jgi:streptogramin lyase
VAIDSSGDAWFASGQTASTVFELSPTGSPLSPPSTGFAASNCPCNGIAADAAGNVWTVGAGGLAEISSAGVQGSVLYPPGFFHGVTLTSLAVDGTGNLWMADQHNHSIWEYSPSTTTWNPATSPTYPNGFPNIAARNNPSHPGRTAIDGAGHKWIANQSTATSGPPASSLTELSADGTINLSPDDGIGSGSINGAYAVAIDGSGNVWVTAGGTSIVQFVGAAAPTKNPVVSAIASGFMP